MVQKILSRKIALIIAPPLFISSLLFVPDWSAVGVFPGCPVHQRILFSLFHASPLHALLNLWCLLSLIFSFEIPVWKLAVALAVAAFIPGCCLSSTPTVGLSVFIYALFGQLALLAPGRRCFFISVAAYILLGFIFPQVNALAHAYAFCAGLSLSLLSLPLSAIIRNNDSLS